MPESLLKTFLHCAPETEGLPAAFHRALLQGWLVAAAEGKHYAPADAGAFLRDVIFSRARQEGTALFLSAPLLDYLNAPSGMASNMPLTRFMALVYQALGAAKAQFDLASSEDCLRFYHAFAGQLANDYFLPHQLIPDAIRMALKAPPSLMPRCAVVTEKDFTAGLAPFSKDVTVIGPADLENGLGGALRYMVDGLKAARVPFSILNRYGMSRSRAAESRLRDYESERSDAPVNVIHFNSDMLADNMLCAGIGNFAGRYNIGYFVWETARLSKAHILGADMVDEIWVPTTFMRDLYGTVTDKPVVTIGSVVQPVPPKGNRETFGLPENDFLFVFTYDSASRLTRKNPLGVVRAFQKAFPSDTGVGLVLKTQNASAIAHPLEKKLHAALVTGAADDRRIKLIDETFTAAQVTGLIACADCYISLHRCEGFGYGMAEAMSLGVPVIATGWSGNADFITPELAWPVPYRRVPIAPEDYHYAQEGGHEWAEPDLDAAAALMRHVFNTPAEATAKAAAAHAWLNAHFSAHAVGLRMKARLAEIKETLITKP